MVVVYGGCSGRLRWLNILILAVGGWWWLCMVVVAAMMVYSGCRGGWCRS